MSEERAEYRVGSTGKNVSWSKFLRSKALKKYASGLYEPPDPREIRTLMNKMEWSSQDVAYLVGAQYNEENGRGSQTVRNWLSDDDSSSHRTIPYAAWRLMLVKADIAQP